MLESNLPWKKIKYTRRHFCIKGQICTKRYILLHKRIRKYNKLKTNKKTKKLPTKGKG